MEYKETLNLPRTEFAMKADLVGREPERLARWESRKLYARIQESRAGREKFVLHDGPPFANGEVHIGTALNKILKDLVVKYHSIRGRNAPFVPGWDCHGLPIEFKVSEEMRKAGQMSVDAATIRTACRAYAEKYIGIQRQQFKRLGVFGDWENPYLTLAKEYEADELRLFADIVERGFVYRGKKPVYWSIPCRTALAEAEVEYQDHVSQSVYVKLPVEGRPGTFILIWTTTPWTLPANLAVAYNSTFNYSVVQVERELFIVSAMLTGMVAEKCGWAGYQIIRTLDGSQLSELEYRHPFINRTGRLHAGDHFVENTTGTGFVHIAPGHGLDDYLLGLQKGLPIYSPVDDNGRFALSNELPVEQQMPAELVGKSILEKNGRSEANEAVLGLLRGAGALVHEEKYLHSYPHCWRSKTPVIFRAMDQWFIRVDHEQFRERALEAIGRVNWVPDWGKNRIEAAVRSRPDWCISRQRTWGVPIPAFATAEGELLLDSRIIRATADLVERHGTNIWFEKPAEELWGIVRPKDWTGPEAVSKTSDTLDVWIDSGSSSRAVLMRRHELAHEKVRDGKRAVGEGDLAEWRADMYLEGSDQHRGWFQSSLLLSLAGNGIPPFGTVLTHGFMVDADREKISKSKQTGYEKPQTAEAYVKKHGADVVRLWVSSQDYRNDIVVSEERINKVSEIYRLLRNTIRYQLSNLFDFDPKRDAVEDGNLTGLDRWILEAFSRLSFDVEAAYSNYEFHTVYQKISQFAAVELSAMYHDLVKDRLYTDPAESHRRRSTQTVLHRMATGLCQMLSPILSFTTDEAWEHLPGKTEESVHLSVWDPVRFERPERERQLWKRLFSIRERVLPELEKKREAKMIGKALEARVILRGGGDYWGGMMEGNDELREILNVSQVRFEAVEMGASGAGNGGEIGVEIGHAEGRKCERCWHWELEVGVDGEHLGLCPRCISAVGNHGRGVRDGSG